METIMDMFNKVAMLPFSGIVGVMLYWVPVSLCAVGYSIRTGRNYYADVEHREAVAKNVAGLHAVYRPTDTLGTLIGRAIVTVMPLANLWAGIFDIAPKMFGGFFRRLEKLLNQPLVPALKSEA